jgi:hypothetical protein
MVNVQGALRLLLHGHCRGQLPFMSWFHHGILIGGEGISKGIGHWRAREGVSLPKFA